MFKWLVMWLFQRRIHEGRRGAVDISISKSTMFCTKTTFDIVNKSIVEAEHGASTCTKLFKGLLSKYCRFSGSLLWLSHKWSIIDRWQPWCKTFTIILLKERNCSYFFKWNYVMDLETTYQINFDNLSTIKLKLQAVKRQI